MSKKGRSFSACFSSFGCPKTTIPRGQQQFKGSASPTLAAGMDSLTWWTASSEDNRGMAAKVSPAHRNICGTLKACAVFTEAWVTAPLPQIARQKLKQVSHRAATTSRKQSRQLRSFSSVQSLQGELQFSTRETRRPGHKWQPNPASASATGVSLLGIHLHLWGIWNLKRVCCINSDLWLGHLHFTECFKGAERCQRSHLLSKQWIQRLS